MELVIAMLFSVILPIAIIWYVCESLHTLRKQHDVVMQRLELLDRRIRTQSPGTHADR